MILDSGICYIDAVRNIAVAGELPSCLLVRICTCYFGDLGYESATIQYTESMEQIEISRRIRVLQNKDIANKAVVTIGTDEYQVERVYHGVDSESGELVSDLSLSKVVSAYVD
jgi:hypothetical protein